MRRTGSRNQPRWLEAPRGRYACVQAAIENKVVRSAGGGTRGVTPRMAGFAVGRRSSRWTRDLASCTAAAGLTCLGALVEPIGRVKLSEPVGFMEAREYGAERRRQHGVLDPCAR